MLNKFLTPTTLLSRSQLHRFVIIQIASREQITSFSIYFPYYPPAYVAFPIHGFQIALHKEFLLATHIKQNEK